MIGIFVFIADSLFFLHCFLHCFAYCFNKLHHLLERDSKELRIVKFIIQKHLDNQIDWEIIPFTNNEPHYVAKIDDLKISLKLYKDNTCWLRFIDTKITFRSEVYSELKIIMQDLKKDSTTSSEIDKIFSKLKLNKNIERDAKIEAVLNSDSILKKIKNTYITKLG